MTRWKEWAPDDGLQRLIRMKQLEGYVGFKKTQIYDQIARGAFPPEPVRVSRRASAWIECEVVDWLSARASERKLLPATRTNTMEELMANPACSRAAALLKKKLEGRETEVLDALDIPWEQTLRGRHIKGVYPNHDLGWRWEVSTRVQFRTTTESITTSFRSCNDGLRSRVEKPCSGLK